MVYKCIDYIQRVLFPSRCRLCLAPGEENTALCAACREDLPWLSHACARCAQLLPPQATHGVCPVCATRPPPLDRCRALFSYQPPIDRWIHALKFGHDLALARLFGQLLLERTPKATDGASHLLAVPLHPRRLRQRGFNQAFEICRPLLRSGWPASRCGCYRRRHTAAQSGLPAGQRHGNLCGAFALRDKLEGERIVLIDDVMTTGATLNELARTLKAAGAARVEAYVIARALKLA